MSVIIDLSVALPKLYANYQQQEEKLKNTSNRFSIILVHFLIDEYRALLETRKVMWQNIIKLFGDFIVASTTGFELKTPIWLTNAAGVISGAIAYYRLYVKSQEPIKL
jgi:hypothetical protein